MSTKTNKSVSAYAAELIAMGRTCEWQAEKGRERDREREDSVGLHVRCILLALVLR